MQSSPACGREWRQLGPRFLCILGFNGRTRPLRDPQASNALGNLRTAVRRTGVFANLYTASDVTLASARSIFHHHLRLPSLEFSRCVAGILVDVLYKWIKRSPEPSRRLSSHETCCLVRAPSDSHVCSEFSKFWFSVFGSTLLRSYQRIRSFPRQTSRAQA